MTITKPKPKTETSAASAEDFIAGAPDSVTPGRLAKKATKQQISLTITPALLGRVDELAERLGQSRAAVINMAIYRAVEDGLLGGSSR